MSDQPYAAGIRVEKINSNPGDMHQDGALGRVVSHLRNTEPLSEVLHEYGYFVRWEDFLLAPVFICGCRLREVKT